MEERIQNNKALSTKYTKADSGFMFVLALIAPYILMLAIELIVTIFFSQTAFYADVWTNEVFNKYKSSVVCQLSLILAFLVYNKLKKINFVKACQIKKSLDIKKLLLVIVIGLVALFGFNYFSGVFLKFLEFLGYNVSNTTGATFGFDKGIGMLFLSIFTTALLPAIAEELCMRGVVYNGLKQNSSKMAILLSALIFMILHLSLEQSIYQFLLGVGLALIVYYTGNIVYSIVLHFVNNATVLIFNYFAPTASSLNFNGAWDYIWPILVAILSVAIISVLFVLLKKICVKDGTFKQNNNVVEDKNKTQENTNNLADIDKLTEDVSSFYNNMKFGFCLAFGVVLWIIFAVIGFVV